MTKTGVLPENTPVLNVKYKNFINSARTSQENSSKFRIIWIYEQSKKKTSGMEAITKEKRRKKSEK